MRALQEREPCVVLAEVWPSVCKNPVSAMRSSAPGSGGGGPRSRPQPELTFLPASGLAPRTLGQGARALGLTGALTPRGWLFPGPQNRSLCVCGSHLCSGGEFPSQQAASPACTTLAVEGRGRPSG